MPLFTFRCVETCADTVSLAVSAAMEHIEITGCLTWQNGLLMIPTTI
jgi:hypothetical protein